MDGIILNVRETCLFCRRSRFFYRESRGTRPIRLVVESFV